MLIKMVIEMKTQTVYKVTNNCYSWNLLLPNSSFFRLEYKLNSKTLPVIGKILAFETPKQAADFIRSNTDINRHVIVFEGIGENPHKIKKLVYNADINGPVFWESKKKKKSLKALTTFDAPNGTIGVDSFSPTKQWSLSSFLNEFEGVKV